MNQILNPIAFVWRTCGVSLFTLSFLNAIFMLAPTVFMLEVYGRAVTSRSDSTLLYLSVAVIVVYIAWGFFDWLRSKLLFDVANLFKRYYEAQHLRAHFLASFRDESTGPGLLADSRVLGTALNSPLLVNLIDLPFTILFFIIIFYWVACAYLKFVYFLFLPNYFFEGSREFDLPSLLSYQYPQLDVDNPPLI